MTFNAYIQYYSFLKCFRKKNTYCLSGDHRMGGSKYYFFHQITVPTNAVLVLCAKTEINTIRLFSMSCFFFFIILLCAVNNSTHPINRTQKKEWKEKKAFTGGYM